MRSTAYKVVSNLFEAIINFPEYAWPKSAATYTGEDSLETRQTLEKAQDLLEYLDPSIIFRVARDRDNPSSVYASVHTYGGFRRLK